MSGDAEFTTAERATRSAGVTARWLARQPVWWATVVLGAASVVALTAPASTQPTSRVAIAAIAAAVAVLVVAVLDRSWRLGLTAVASGAVGFLLRDGGDAAVRAATWILLAAVVVIGLDSGRWLRTQQKLTMPVAIATGLIVASLGPLFVAYDRQMLPMGLGLSGVLITAASAAGVALAGRSGHLGRLHLRDALGGVVAWANDQMRVGDPGADDVADKLMLDETRHRPQLIRFFALMAFAATIASFGVLADSTAVVIGAMLIAPLMQPLMATSLALVSGWTAALGRSLGLVIAGAVVTIGAGVFATAVIGQGTDPATNTQIITRANPNLLDLAIALAAGAAGAYAYSRRDVSDSLPGVAVAIALVPPLAVVGVTLQLGDTASAAGALLLFATNAVAIIAMGALTFVGTGVAGGDSRSRRPVGGWVLAIAGASAAVLWVLVANSSTSANVGARETIARGVVDGWIDGRDYAIDALDIDGSDVRLVLIGPEAPDDAADLADRLGALLDGELSLDLRITLQEQVSLDP